MRAASRSAPSLTARPSAWASAADSAMTSASKGAVRPPAAMRSRTVASPHGSRSARRSENERSPPRRWAARAHGSRWE